MSEFRILDYNYVFDSTVGKTASSSNPNFPVSNLSKYTRAKVWRSSGFFSINSSNNKIDFNDGTGSVTATITTGNYTTTSLAAEIKTRLDTAGSLTHTVSYSSSTGKWTISVASGTFSILWLTGTNNLTSIGTTIGFSILADSSAALSYVGSKIAIHTEESVTIDLKTSESIDSIAILFDPNDGCNFSNSAVITLQASQTQNWTNPALSQVLSLDLNFNSITHFFAASSEYRYWRLKIVDPSNANLYVELPLIYLSLATQLTQQPEIGISSSLVDQTNVQVNEYGNTYSDIYPIRKSFGFNYAHLSESDIQTMQLIYDKVGSFAPICVSLDSTATVFDKDRFFLYGNFASKFTIENSFYSYFNLKIEMTEKL